MFSLKVMLQKNKNKLIDAFKAFKLLMKINEVDFYRACATSAMREAENRHEICESILQNTGMT